MAIHIPSGCYVQKDVNKGSDDEGKSVLEYPIKGGYSALETLRASLTQKTEVISGWIAKSWNLQGLPGDSGILTINCKPTDMTGEPEEEGGDPTQEPLKDLWSIKSVRNDISIMAYCGPSEGANPNRVDLEAWMKEPDAEIANLFQYRKKDGTVKTLNAASQAVANKIVKGIEAVIRFYPIVMRKRIYSQVPPACLENIGYIDTPSGPSGGKAEGPNGLATAIAAHQWLKIKDDADEQSDGNWARVEGWMGIPSSDGSGGSPWDADLYGEDRWSMPYENL